MQIRVMTHQDIPGGVRLNTIIGWNQTAADWERFLAASPNGCFVMEDADKIVGTSATISYEDKFAWIGMVLVDPDYRNRGIGTTLLQRAVEYLDGAGIPTLKLDATPAGKPLYEKMGFVTEYEIDRWVLKRSVIEEPLLPHESTAPKALSEALDFDRQAFGADRSKLLHSYNDQAPDLTLVAQTNGQLAGYAFGRRGLFADHMGAWMARDDDTAQNSAFEVFAALFARHHHRRCPEIQPHRRRTPARKQIFSGPTANPHVPRPEFASRQARNTLRHSRPGIWMKSPRRSG